MFPSLKAISLQPVSTRFMIYVTFPHRCLTDVNVFLFVRLLTSIRLQHFILFYFFFFVPGCAPERGCCVNVKLFKFGCFLFVFSCMRLIKLVFKKIGPGIRQVRPPQHDVWGALECTAAPVSVHKDIHLDFEEVVTTYGHKHPRRMLLGRPLDAWFSSWWTSFFWSSRSSQWLQIFCKNCKYMYKLPCKFAPIFLKLYPKIVKNAYLRIPIFKISRGSMPPDPLEGARTGPRRDRVAITSFGFLEFHAPPPPPPWLKSWIRHWTLSIAWNSGRPAVVFLARSSLWVKSERSRIRQRLCSFIFFSIPVPVQVKNLPARSREKKRVELNETALLVGDIYSDLRVDLAMTGAINVRFFSLDLSAKG